MMRWTEEEDALLIDNRAHAGSWAGWRTMLPHRSEESINSRRQKLGIQFDNGGPHLGLTKHPRPKTTDKAFRRPKVTSPWTDEQRAGLIKAVMEMLDVSGHGFHECMDELGRLLTLLGDGETI